MEESTSTKAYLLLEDGTLFEGLAMGKKGTTVGEICFNTGMTGYQEIYTDPSYFGQILVNTCAHIGNYGTLESDAESDNPKIAGLVVKNNNVYFSRQKSKTSLQEYLENHNTVGISGVDTRQIVRHIRQKGAMNAIISSEHSDIALLKGQLAKAPSMEGLELASSVSTTIEYDFGLPNAQYRIAAIDFGIKRNILRSLAERNALVKVFPHNTPFEKIAAWNPDAFFLSNGPGDPASMPNAVNLANKMIESDKPVFGICLGHQIISLALGIPTYKMRYGHRGLNHPVIHLKTGQCEITSQNHGFGIVNEIAYQKKDIIEVTHVNLNDDTVEGIRMINKPVFCVQYHPEASPGPHDARYLFDQFIENIKRYKNN
jgi:carbamoyl-phosphate synthase small subunit